MWISGGKSPAGWAAAAVYNACLDVGDKRTQGRIAEVANVSEVTIRNRYQEQRETLRALDTLPSDPVEIIEHVDDLSEISPSVRSTAIALIRRGQQRDIPVNDNPTLWALAALRRAGEVTGETMSLKTLTQFTDESSAEISTRSKTLRSVDVPVTKTRDGSGSGEPADSSVDHDEQELFAPDRGSVSVDCVARAFDQRRMELESTVQEAIHDGSVDRVPQAIEAAQEAIVTEISETCSSTCLEQIRTANEATLDRVRELVRVYNRGELRVSSDFSDEEALKQKIMETIDRNRDSAVDIANEHCS